MGLTLAKNYILDTAIAAKKLHRMALEIIEDNADEKEIVLVGIADNGTVLAKAIQQIVSDNSNISIQRITLTLDKRKPGKISLSEEINFDDKVVILVDDVANSGKTLLYSLKPFLEFYPRKIQTLVLVGRRHNSFPVYPDYVGLQLATTLQEHIYVEVINGEIKGAYLE